MKGEVRKQVIEEAKHTVAESFAHLRRLGLEPTLNVCSDQNIAELLTQHPSRMAFGMFTYIFADGQGAIRRGRNEMGYAVGEELASGFFELIGGQPRCSIIHDAFTYRICGVPLEDYFEGFVSRYLARIQEDTSLANYPEIVLYEQNPSLGFLVELFGPKKGARYHRCYEEFFRGIRVFEKRVIADFRGRLEPEFLCYIKREQETVRSFEEFDLPEVLATVQRYLDHLRMVSCVTFVKIARLGFFAYARLKRKLESEFGPDEGRKLLDKLTSGLSDDPSLHFNVVLAKLRDGAIPTESVLTEFGHLGPNELEIAGPRYREVPDLVERYATQIVGHPEEELAERVAESRRAEDRVLTQVDSSEREEILQDIESARLYLAVREKQKFYYLMEYDLIRKLLLQAERLLNLKDGQIFLLDPRELGGLLEHPGKTLALIEERHSRESALHRLEIPAVLFTDRLDAIRYPLYEEGVSELHGIGVTSESSIGEAVVVLDPRDERSIQKIRDGSILIAPTTDPTWAPLIASVGKGGGLVTEVGGPLAHGAIVARELGIAAVLNIAGITKIVKDGDLLEVDGPKGTVSILRRS